MINQMILQGRLVADPELRYTQSQIPVASFKVAWSEKYKDAESKCFMACVAWRATGEFVKNYFAKGQEILVRGKVVTRDWTDKNGNKRQSDELVCDEVSFCGPKQGQDTNSAASAAKPVYVEMDEDDGDLPF